MPHENQQLDSFIHIQMGHNKDSLLLAKNWGKKKHFRSRAGRNQKVGLKKFSKETGHYVNGLCLSLGVNIVGFFPSLCFFLYFLVFFYNRHI